MKNLDQRNQIIEYSLKLNSTNLSPLRSGNISLRGIEDDIEGYLITPSGKKYETLKPEDIVFMGLNEEEENDASNKPSSEWRFHRDIYVNKKEAQAIVHFPVSMRIPPTALEGVAGNLYQASDGSTGHAGTNLTLTGNVRTHNTACVSLATTGLVSKNPYYVEANGNAAGTKYLRFSAEI